MLLNSFRYLARISLTCVSSLQISLSQGSVVELAGIGVQLLWQLVSEMNQLSESDATLTLTKHRKIASSFRDVHLYEIFQLSCTLLRNALENFRNMNFEDQGQVRSVLQCYYREV